jgi:hypothetical protein
VIDERAGGVLGVPAGHAGRQLPQRPVVGVVGGQDVGLDGVEDVGREGLLVAVGVFATWHVAALF